MVEKRLLAGLYDYKSHTRAHMTTSDDTFRAPCSYNNTTGHVGTQVMRVDKLSGSHNMRRAALRTVQALYRLAFPKLADRASRCHTPTLDDFSKLGAQSAADGASSPVIQSACLLQFSEAVQVRIRAVDKGRTL